MFINSEMDKEMWYIYNGILLNHKKTQSKAICSKEPNVYHRELYSIFCNGLYGKESKKNWIYTFVQMIFFAVHLKLMQEYAPIVFYM